MDDTVKARLLQKGIAWAKEQEALILRDGGPLSPTEVEIAKKVGVDQAERVRILEVPAIPPPADAELRQAALAAGLLSPTFVGMTFGYGVYIVQGNRERIMAHEMRHVFQFESAGSVENFAQQYLEQLAAFGYRNAPLEVDARAYGNTTA